jgi:hypothetical protein
MATVTQEQARLHAAVDAAERIGHAPGCTDRAAAGRTPVAEGGSCSLALAGHTAVAAGAGCGCHPRRNNRGYSYRQSQTSVRCRGGGRIERGS